LDGAICRGTLNVRNAASTMLDILIYFLLMVVVGERRVNLAEAQVRKLPANVLRMPMVGQVILDNFDNLSSCAGHDGNAVGIDFDMGVRDCAHAVSPIYAAIHLSRFAIVACATAANSRDRVAKASTPASPSPPFVGLARHRCGTGNDCRPLAAIMPLKPDCNQLSVIKE
jgi:hypothetical protein